MTNEQMRADFEAHINDCVVSENLFRALEVDSPGDYLTTWVQGKWQSWQAATLKANQWMTIADAPKDGSLFLGATDKGAVQIIKRNKHLHIWITDDGKESFRTMTYWLPLPPTGTEGDV